MSIARELEGTARWEARQKSSLLGYILEEPLVLIFNYFFIEKFEWGLLETILYLQLEMRGGREAPARQEPLLKARPTVFDPRPQVFNSVRPPTTPPPQILGQQSG